MYILPIGIILYQYNKENSFFISYWYLYILGIGYLFYSHYCWVQRDVPQMFSVKIKKIYFTYLYFFILFLIPIINRDNKIVAEKISFLGLSRISFTIVILFITGLIGYILIIADIFVGELSIGEAKVTMKREEYVEVVNNNIDLTNNILSKIAAEHTITNNIHQYAAKFIGKCKTNKNINFNQCLQDTLQEILQDYYNCQKESAKIYLVSSMEESVKNEYSLKTVEFNDLINKMKAHKIYTMKRDKTYSFIPILIKYNYRERSGEYETYIILEADTSFINEERYIFENIIKAYLTNLLCQL